MNVGNEQEQKEKELCECYYCDTFTSTPVRKDYEQHVTLKHLGKLAYPTIADLELHNIKPKGKSWE